MSINESNSDFRPREEDTKEVKDKEKEENNQLIPVTDNNDDFITGGKKDWRPKKLFELGTSVIKILNFYGSEFKNKFLEETKDDNLKVVDYIDKLFPGFNNWKYDQDTKSITHFLTAYEDTITFIDPVPYNNLDVETFLNNLTKELRSSVYAVVADCVQFITELKFEGLLYVITNEELDRLLEIENRRQIREKKKRQIEEEENKKMEEVKKIQELKEKSKKDRIEQGEKFDSDEEEEKEKLEKKQEIERKKKELIDEENKRSKRDRPLLIDDGTTLVGEIVGEVVIKRREEELEKKRKLDEEKEKKKREILELAAREKKERNRKRPANRVQTLKKVKDWFENTPPFFLGLGFAMAYLKYFEYAWEVKYLPGHSEEMRDEKWNFEDNEKVWNELLVEWRREEPSSTGYLKAKYFALELEQNYFRNYIDKFKEIKSPSDPKWKEHMKFTATLTDIKYQETQDIVEFNMHLLNYTIPIETFNFVNSHLRLWKSPQQEEMFKKIIPTLVDKKVFCFIAPPGSGKVTYFRELSYLLGRVLYKVECSENMTGNELIENAETAFLFESWIVFDEVNRLKPDELKIFSEKLPGKIDEFYNSVKKENKAGSVGIFLTVNPLLENKTLPEELEKIIVKHEQDGICKPEYYANILFHLGYKYPLDYLEQILVFVKRLAIEIEPLHKYYYYKDKEDVIFKTLPKFLGKSTHEFKLTQYAEVRKIENNIALYCAYYGGGHHFLFWEHKPIYDKIYEEVFGKGNFPDDYLGDGVRRWTESIEKSLKSIFSFQVKNENETEDDFKERIKYVYNRVVSLRFQHLLKCEKKGYLILLKDAKNIKLKMDDEEKGINHSNAVLFTLSNSPRVVIHAFQSMDPYELFEGTEEEAPQLRRRDIFEIKYREWRDRMDKRMTEYSWKSDEIEKEIQASILEYHYHQEGYRYTTEGYANAFMKKLERDCQISPEDEENWLTFVDHEDYRYDDMIGPFYSILQNNTYTCTLEPDIVCRFKPRQVKIIMVVPNEKFCKYRELIPDLDVINFLFKMSDNVEYENYDPVPVPDN